MSEYITEWVARPLDDECVREEIVRCRDCKMFNPKEGEALSCRFEYKDFVQWRNAEPDGFCAWGEKVVG